MLEGISLIVKEQVRIKKKENWLKPVKAAKIPSTYQYK